MKIPRSARLPLKEDIPAPVTLTLQKKIIYLETKCLLFLRAYSRIHERQLLDDLLGYYNKLERPVANESEAVVLTFGLTLQQIIDTVRFTFPSSPKYEVNSFLTTIIALFINVTLCYILPNCTQAMAN